MAPVDISVTGSSVIYRYPERAYLSLRASARGRCQETVSREATAAANELHRMLKELSPKTDSGEATSDAPVTSFSLGCMRNWSDSPSRWREHYEPDDRVYHAQVNIEATFRDFAKLGELSPILFGMPNVEVTGLDWRLTDDTWNSLRSESRKLAILNAIQAANEYAEVIKRDVAVVQVNDMHRPGVYAGARFCSTRDEYESLGLDVTPQDIKQTHDVEVKFRGE